MQEVHMKISDIFEQATLTISYGLTLGKNLKLLVLIIF